MSVTNPNSGVPRWLRAAIDWVHDVLKILWLCAAAILMAAFGGLVFIGNDQGQDVLRMLVDPDRPGQALRITIFAASVLAWSLSSWYTSRLLLLQKLPSAPLHSGRTGHLREWLPRVLGVLPPAIIATAFALLDADERLLAAGFALGTVLLLAFYWGRRRLMPSLGPVQEQIEGRPWTMLIILGVAVVLTFVLLGVFVAHPVRPARFLGSASILVLAGTSLLLFFSIVLTYVPLSYRLPSGALLVFLWSFLCSSFNDNHLIQQVPQADAPASQSASASAASSTGSSSLAAASQSVPAVPARRGLHRRADPLPAVFKQWLTVAQTEAGAAAPLDADRTPSGTYPVFIVAAAGGGIRAAYWSAAVLAHAVKEVGDTDLWRRHLFAMSGVSGGALGVSVHRVELQQGRAPDDYLKPAEAMLGADHIAPVLAYMLFPDLLQRFIFFPLPAFDRARALEASWEVSGHQYLGGQDFAGPFLDLWQDSSRALPSLLLSSMRVESGQRVIVTNLPLSDEFVDAVDLLKPTKARESLDRITLAAAVHLSARFTYISPAARVESGDGGLWGRLVDGGYFESSGAVTAADLVRAICPDWNRTDHGKASTTEGPPVCSKDLQAQSFPRIVPVVLMIENDPEGSSLCDEFPQVAASDGPLTEIKPPIEALLAARDARGRVAERSIIRLIEGRDRPSGVCDDGCVLELAVAPRRATDAAREADMRRNKYNDPPLGWSLAATSRAAMDARFQDSDIKDQITCIANLAKGKRCDTAQSCRRHAPVATPGTDPGAPEPEQALVRRQPIGMW